MVSSLWWWLVAKSSWQPLSRTFVRQWLSSVVYPLACLFHCPCAGRSTVCDSGFMNQAAQVACRALNSSWPFGIAVYGAAYGQGVGPVLLTYLKCNGTEQSLLECGPDAEKHNNCTHENNVGLVCRPEPLTQTVPGFKSASCAAALGTLCSFCHTNTGHLR